MILKSKTILIRTYENPGNPASNSDSNVVNGTVLNTNTASTSHAEASYTDTSANLPITNPPTSPVSSSLSFPKLPKLELPKFTGKVTEWSAFWDLYNNAIHSNANMSKVKKFNYLFSLLEGNAARSVKGLTLTSVNYDAAIEILQERFGKPQQIIAAHMDQILQIPACTDGRTVQLRFVFDKISVHACARISIT